VSYTQTPHTTSGRRRVARRIAMPVLAAATALTLAGTLCQPALASSSATASAPGSVAAPGRLTVASWGAGYLARQIIANGGHLNSFGVTDVVDTAYAVLGLRAAGVGRSASSLAIAFLKTQLASPLENADGSDNPGNLAYFILAAVSAGQDPRHFAGRSASNDLVARLVATRRATGPDAGLFGTNDPTYDGAFRQGLALAALAAAKVPASRGVVQGAIRWLEHQQCADGLWTAYRADTTVPCPAADLTTFVGPDTNSTGMAVQGLAAYGARPGRARLLATLHAIQSADGGFPFLGSPGQASDPDSTALSIQLILAEGGYPGAAAWQKGAGNPYVALAAYQLGCGDPAADRGAFFYPGSRTPSTLASVQAIPALAGRTFPLSSSPSSTTQPQVNCLPAAASARSAVGVAPRAGTGGHCPAGTGVTVAVDFSAFGKGTVVRCAPGKPATGIAALQQAGFTVAGTANLGLAFVCRIQSLPSATQTLCATTPPPTAYWAYFHALAGATTWSFSSLGATSYRPPQGSIDAWAFGKGALPSKTPAQVRKS